MPLGSLTGAAILGGSSILGGFLGAGAAESAANTQANAEQNAINVQQQMFNTQNQQLAPQRAAGYSSLNQIGALGNGSYQTYDANGNPTGTAQGSGYLTHQFDAQDLTNGLSPNYNFSLQQGEMANQRAANLGGGAIGGNALQGLNQYSQNYAQGAYQQAFNNYQTQRSDIYNTLAGIAGIGQTAENTTASLASNTAGNIGQAMVGAGNAQASGTIGAANALSSGLGSAAQGYYLSNLLGQGGGGSALAGGVAGGDLGGLISLA